MKKQSIIILTFSILLSGVGFNQLKAQESVIDGAYSREHITERSAVPYQGVREADVMFSKRVLRMIDLDEKINQPLYFPIKPIHYPASAGMQPARSRVSLIYLLFRIGIMNKEEANRQLVFKFDPNDFNNWYKTPIPIDDTVERYNVLTYQEDVEVLNEVTGMKEWETVPRTIALQDVKSYLIWEEWFFDKQRSVSDVRIIAMAPVARFLTEKNGVEEMEVQRLFWIPFRNYRNLFAKYEVFNVFNDAERRSFDDIFAQRRFQSYIIAESNVYDNRFIRDYLLGIDAMREGEKIEAEIFDFEQDLWEY